jgi:type I restriction enzyme S subunit
VTSKVERLGNLVRIRTGKLDANASSPEGIYPFFTCAKEPLRIDTYSYDCECVLVAGNGDLNAKYFKGRFDAYQRTYIIEALAANIIDIRYLFHFMDKYVEQLRSMSIGGVIKYIKLEYLTEVKIPLLPMEEQRRIAAILDKADALRQKRRTALQKLDSLTQSIFLDMFGQTHKDTVQIGELAEIRTGGTPSRKNESNFGGLIPWVKTTEVFGDEILGSEEHLTSEGLASSNCKIFPKGSIVIAMYGQGRTRGQCSMLGFDAATNQACAVILPNDRFRPRFLLAILKSKYEELRSLARGGNQANLNLELIKNIPVFLPPKSEQEEFEKRLDVIYEMKALFRKSTYSLDSVFVSLQHRAFRGEL